MNMAVVEELVTTHLDLWTSAIRRKSAAGRGSPRNTELYGIKKLRELILELAVRGMLVPQDPNDEPASELLKKIALERAKLIIAGRGKKKSALPAVTDKEMPFSLPLGWSCERIGNLVSKLGSGSTPRGGKEVYVNEGIRFLRSQNVWNDGIDLEDIAYISLDTHEKMSGTKVVPGDVLLNITGASLGRSAIFPNELVEANVSQHVTIIRLLLPEMARFVHVGVLSPMIQKVIRGRQVGMAIEGLSKKVLEMFEFPIPPLAEQRRIVAKVDELMSLCDQLEAQSGDSFSAHQTLVESLLNALTSAADNVQFASAWQRIAEHFDTLFVTEESIDQFKRTLLHLAVTGKLVPQDPNDEPASELLKKIAAAKAKLVNKGKIKNEKLLTPADEERPFGLPIGWEWIRLADLLPEFQNGASSRGDKGGIPTIVLRLADIKNKRISLAETRAIPIYEGDVSKYGLTQGDVLVVRVNGSADIVGQFIPVDAKLRAIYCDHFIRMRIKPEWCQTSYLCLLGQTELVREKISDMFITTAGQKTVNQGHIGSLLVPIPPIAEQSRIVVKVDELMALCDLLKSRLSDSQATQLQLADTMAEKALAEA